jgi:hypothetical protein
MIVCLQVNDLRMKARLHVLDGVTLMGVMDEFNMLEEGQVFVQVMPLQGPRMISFRADMAMVSVLDSVMFTMWLSGPGWPQ